jgi:hypothetical protein
MLRLVTMDLETLQRVVFAPEGAKTSPAPEGAEES